LGGASRRVFHIRRGGLTPFDTTPKTTKTITARLLRRQKFIASSQ